MFREVLGLPLGPVNLRVQFVDVSFVKLSGDGLVDVHGHCVVPERRIFLYGIKTSDLPRASGVRSVDRIEPTM